MSPVIDNGLLIAHVGGHDKGALTAFDVETGAVKWSNDADGPAYASPIIATLAGVRQLVAFMQKDLVGVDAATGKLLWKIPARSEYDTNSVTAVTYKDMVVFAREGQGLRSSHGGFESGQQIPSFDCSAGNGAGGKCLVGTEDEARNIGRTLRVAMDFDLRVGKIDDPVLGHSIARVSSELVPAILGQRGVGYFHEQDGVRGMPVRVVFDSSGNYGEVRFWRRDIIQGKRRLRADVAA